MSEKKVVKPVALAVGAALAGTFALSGTVNADAIESPFTMSTMSRLWAWRSSTVLVPGRR